MRPLPSCCRRTVTVQCPHVVVLQTESPLNGIVAQACDASNVRDGRICPTCTTGVVRYSCLEDMLPPCHTQGLQIPVMTTGQLLALTCGATAAAVLLTCLSPRTRLRKLGRRRSHRGFASSFVRLQRAHHTLKLCVPFFRPSFQGSVCQEYPLGCRMNMVQDASMDCRVPAATKVDLMSQCPQLEDSLLACKIRRKRPPTVPCLLHSDGLE